MPRQLGVPRRSVATVLAAVLAALSVTVPLLDRDAEAGAWVIHAEHPLSTHPNAHDHTLCTQHGSSSLPELNATEVPSAPHEGMVPAPAFDFRLHSRTRHAPSRSRAPPIA